MNPFYSYIMGRRCRTGGEDDPFTTVIGIPRYTDEDDEDYTITSEDYTIIIEGDEEVEKCIIKDILYMMSIFIIGILIVLSLITYIQQMTMND